MKTLVTSLLITHIAIGIVALLVGLIPMFSKKGGRLHNRAGLVYVWCMWFIAATSLLLCILQPFRMMRLFLTGIAVFSFYLTTTGWRATKQKTGQYTWGDRLLTYVTLVVSLAMISFGLYLIYRQGVGAFFAILFTFFGFLTFRFAWRDVQLTRQPTQKMQWFFLHFTRMGGAYIATFTAALVNNSQRILPLSAPEWLFSMLWIIPSVIGGLVIIRTVRYYRAKFKVV